MNKVLLLVGLVLCTTIAISPDEGEAAPNPIPLSTVSFDSDIYRVMARPHSPSMVIMYCNVTVEKACIERVVVHLTGEMNSDWPFEIKPATIPFLNPGFQKFVVKVIVPPGASYQFREFTVSATVKAPGLARYVSSSSCLIIPKPLYTSYVEPVGSPCVVGEDGKAMFSVRVWNTGTIEDVYSIDLSSRSMPLRGWDCPVELVVPPRSFIETDIKIDYKEPILPCQLWKVDLILISGNSSAAAETVMCYTGETASRELMVYDQGPPIGPIFDLPPVITVFIIQLAILVSVLVIYSRRSS